jgi:hypothetical protein
MKSSSRHSLTPQTAAEELIVAQALALYRDSKAIAKNAPYGQFLNHAEAIVITKGRQFIQTTLQTIAQEEVDNVEKKNETKECPKCNAKKRHRGYRKKQIVTAAGNVKIKRRYDECRYCKMPECTADAMIGLADYTVGFRSLAVRAGADSSFQKAAEDLLFYCGLKIGRMTIRKLCYLEAPKMAKWQQKAPEVASQFIKATGNVEVTIDATKVNTMGGWRDAKLCILSKRPLGEGVSPTQWSKRKLPQHTARVAFAAIEKKSRFRNRLSEQRRRLRPGLTGDISALADGAAWIWDIVRLEFGKVRECLDIYHALEYVSKVGKIVYGEGTETFKKWYKTAKKELLSGGFELLDKRLNDLEREDRSDKEKESLRRLREYLSFHSERLCYRERLSEGRAIGSGQVEGACKSLIGKRLKQTGARWKVRNLNRMMLLCTARYGTAWDEYWKQAI